MGIVDKLRGTGQRPDQFRAPGHALALPDAVRQWTPDPDTQVDAQLPFLHAYMADAVIPLLNPTTVGEYELLAISGDPKRTFSQYTSRVSTGTLEQDLGVAGGVWVVTTLYGGLKRNRSLFVAAAADPTDLGTASGPAHKGLTIAFYTKGKQEDALRTTQAISKDQMRSKRLEFISKQDGSIPPFLCLGGITKATAGLRISIRHDGTLDILDRRVRNAAAFSAEDLVHGVMDGLVEQLEASFDKHAHSAAMQQAQVRTDAYEQGERQKGKAIKARRDGRLPVPPTVPGISSGSQS